MPVPKWICVDLLHAYILCIKHEHMYQDGPVYTQRISSTYVCSVASSVVCNVVGSVVFWCDL